jgi:hypothetical protein
MQRLLYIVFILLQTSGSLSLLFPLAQQKPDVSRRSLLVDLTATSSLLVATSLSVPTASAASARLDVSNALAREYTAFPGLYPTIATKLVNAVKDQPFKSKKEIYQDVSYLQI